MRKLLYLESIRGLAALTVVFTHFVAVFYPSSIFGGSYQPHETWERLFTKTPMGIFFAGHAAVALFFILSGYVLSVSFFGPIRKTNQELLAAIIKRPIRLGGLVIFSGYFSWILSRSNMLFNKEVSQLTHSIPWFQQYWSDSPVGFLRFTMDQITHPFEIGYKYNIPLWTIGIELYCSIMTFIFLLLFRDSRLRPLGYLIAGIIYYNHYFQTFLVGICLADITSKEPNYLHRFSGSWLWCALLPIGLLLASFPQYVSELDRETGLYSLFPPIHGIYGNYSMLGAACVFTSVLLSPTLQRMLSYPAMVFLGRISYPMYVLHFLLIGSFSSWVFLRIHPVLHYNQAVLLVACFSLPVLVFLSYILVRYFDDPITRFSSSIAKIWRKSLIQGQ